MMTIIPIKSFVVRQSNGTLKSYAVGISYTVSSEEAEYFINEGLAEKASSGGGDYETVSVKITNKSGSTIDVLGLPIIYDEDSYTGIAGVAGDQINNDMSMTFNVPLYKGVCYWQTTQFDTYQTFTFVATGEITSEDGECVITGAGEITVLSGK